MNVNVFLEYIYMYEFPEFEKIENLKKKFREKWQDQKKHPTK